MRSNKMTHMILPSLFVLLMVSHHAHSATGSTAQTTQKSKASPVENIEIGQVKPVTMSPDGSKIFAINAPNGTLDIYTIHNAKLTYTASVVVGQEPTAVAALSNKEVWVVNHKSDSVSIVDVSLNPPKVTRTLSVGEEPRDIVFGGANKSLAFITTAGSTRGSVWVFDTAAVGNSVAGDPVTILSVLAEAAQPQRARSTPSKWGLGLFNGVFTW